MANTIALAKKYSAMLDELYKLASLTSDMDTAENLIKEGYNANEIVIPKLDMDGLADYDRNSGYVDGDVTLTWQTVACDFDKGRMFSVDELDNAETGGVAFGRIAGEFVRTKVVPQLDAYRMASYAQLKDISKADAADLTTGAQVVSAIRAATNKMDEDEVPLEGRILYITPTLKGLIDDLDTTKSKAVLSKFSKIKEIPQSRFYTKINQFDGKSEGQEKGGYEKAAEGKNINFLIVHPSAVIQGNKLVKPKIITPEHNQNADAWKYGYRLVSIAKGYENKRAGIYLHNATT